MRPRTSMEGKGPGTPRKGKSSTLFNFDPPPEAPVFLPTLEEFENPLKYINKIRPVGQLTGICKIIPPKGWKAPFVLDMDKLKFTPRIQRINELEARTRIKLNFIDQLTKFYALRGKTFQIPVIEKRALDLYTLHKLVKERGGHENVTKNKIWTEIASEMNFNNVKTHSLLKTHFDHIILPFIVARSEAERRIDSGEMDCALKQGLNIDRHAQSLRELRSLTFLGPGPKMAVCDLAFSKSAKTRTRGKKIMYEFDPLAKYMCKSCSNGDIEELLVDCVMCEDKYHPSCLIPPLSDVASTTWKCPKCVATEVCKPLEDFGFAQAEREYTLNEFREMADKFKRNYFKMEPNIVPTNIVESEFWRVVSSIEESVTVEYGADLHVIDHGSGFPLKDRPSVAGIDKDQFDKYADSEWNLNNLPVLKASVLKHISADISGMKIPWMYAGMCFATFCWHNEDHWSYSINYLHLGEPKTWYGVPGSSAEDFELAMKSEAPELFDSQPDILHQLVTIMNPNDIMKTGVPIYRTDQREGEFVITFPRAYHAGFNQGFNFAEACNFAPYDWLHIGRECISHYSSLKRFCVFSHDELVCKMAELYDELDKKILLATYKDMRTMVNAEHARRRFLLQKGIKNASRIRFDELPDDERQCFVCNTTCFLSALACKCSPGKLVCLEHHDSLCKCPYTNKRLKYHYKIDELVAILYVIRNKVEHYDQWMITIDKSFTDLNRKFYFRMFTELLISSKEKELTKNQLLSVLENQVQRCISISSMARKYIKSAVSDNCKGDKKISMDDLIMVSKDMKTYPSTMMETSSMDKLIECAAKIRSSMNKIINTKYPKKAKVEQCIRLANSLNLHFPEMPLLQLKLKEVKWLKKAKKILDKNHKPCHVDLLEELAEEAKELEDCKKTQKERKEILRLFFSVEKWKTDIYNKLDPMTATSYLTLNELQSILQRSEHFNLLIPEVDMLADIVQKSEKLNDQIESVLKGESVLYLHEIYSLIEESAALPVIFPQAEQLRLQLKTTQSWLLSASNLFCRKNISYEILSVLWPRKFNSRASFHKRQQDLSMSEALIDVNSPESSKKIKKRNFKEAFREQMKSLRILRVSSLMLKSERNMICPCGIKIGGKFIECELCFTFYHDSCIKQDYRYTSISVYSLCKKYICNFCLRSKRPPFEKVRALMNSARKTTIKVPEMLVLEYTYSKITRWLLKVKEILRTEEMVKGLKFISENSSAISSACALKRTGIDGNGKDDLGPPTWQNIFSILSESEDIHRIVISTAGVLELRRLMLKGDLFEVTFKETVDIWSLTQVVKLQMYMPAMPNINTTKRSPVLVGLLPPKSPNTKSKLNVVKKISIKTKKNPNVKRVMRKLNMMGGGGGNTALVINAKSSSSPTKGIPGFEEHDLEERCASEVCLRPADDSLDWVQCDGRCGQWFHMRCVDLTRQELSEEDDFVCLQCIGRDSSQEQEIPLADVASLVFTDALQSAAADPLL